MDILIIHSARSLRHRAGCESWIEGISTLRQIEEIEHRT